MQQNILEVGDRSVTLRRAEEDDLEEIVALIADDEIARSRGDSLGAEDRAAYRTAFRAIDQDPAQLLVVAIDTESVVGTLQLTFIPGLSRRGALRMQIEAVRVGAAHRGTGLGSAMITWSLEEGRRRGASLAQLTSDKARPEAHRFYQRLGFVPSHVGYKIQL
jgi:GNAT superfamily N-acetyltransferase